MRTMIMALVATGLSLTVIPATPVEAQYRYRAPHVYNPARYNNTRSTMNYRAAARAAGLRRYCRQHPRVARCRGRPIRY